jgi:hypothetical protein
VHRIAGGADDEDDWYTCPVDEKYPGSDEYPSPLDEQYPGSNESSGNDDDEDKSVADDDADDDSAVDKDLEDGTEEENAAVCTSITARQRARNTRRIADMCMIVADQLEE